MRKTTLKELITVGHDRPPVPEHLVTVRTLSGESFVGFVRDFSPEAPHVMLLPAPSVLQQEPPTSRHRILRDEIVRVAFHRRSYDGDFSAPEEPVTLKIHCVGGPVCRVVAEQSQIGNALGFYAVPESRRSPFARFYFFANTVNAREDIAKLGTLLIRDGALSADKLTEGLLAQNAERRVPIEQILVQQQKVSAEAAEKAQKSQGRQRMRIGEALVSQGLATEEDIERALAEQKRRQNKRLGDVLVDLKIISESALYRALARKFHLPFVDLDEVDLDQDSIESVGHELIRKYGCLPLGMVDGTLLLAISDPLDFAVLDALRFARTGRIREVLAIPRQLAAYVEKVLVEASQEKEPAAQVSDILLDLHAELEELGDEVGDEVLEEASEGAIVRLVNQTIIDACRMGASDIHIEPNGREDALTVRLRKDGQCHLYQHVPAAFRNNMVARLKVMAKLDIAERRRPQDGKIRFTLGDETVELRISTMPTVGDGEDLVMRILAASKPIPLDEMGMTQPNLDRLRRLVKSPYGLVLCVGPTGSGKTTTLHSALGEINRTETKIWTAEDPVEITQPGLRQVQVNPNIGFTFAQAMRGFLRLDPDVIMVGEMRDFETASIAVEASLTGHLVLSTLHTNSAPETLTRLLDMGLDPFTFGDALLGVLAQRLTRALCKNCRKPYSASSEEFETIAEIFGQEGMHQKLGIAEKGHLRLWRAEGCSNCDETGYKGRIALHELLVNEEPIQRAIQRKATAAEIRSLAMAGGGMQTLLQDGVQKAIDGKTDLTMVMAVCRQ